MCHFTLCFLTFRRGAVDAHAFVFLDNILSDDDLDLDFDLLT